MSFEEVVKTISTRYHERVSPERVHQLVERLGNLLRADARRLGASHGLLPVHVHALVYLYRCNVLSNNPSAVSEYLGITKGTASQTLLRLEEKGLLRREADPDDARSVRLEPDVPGTKAGARGLTLAAGPGGPGGAR